MNLLLTFILLNIINVILQTVKSICTVKCGKTMAAIVNALAYGLYTVVIIYMVCDLPLLTKAIVVATCNLIGVYIVKLIEEKTRKDKLWLVQLSIPYNRASAFEDDILSLDLPYNRMETTGTYEIFNVYCATQKESALTKTLATHYNAKYFVSESKVL